MTATAMYSLPDRIRLRLDQALAQWRRWRCDTPLDSPPEPRRILGGGLSNYTVLVGAERKFVVRLDGIDPAATGLHRQVEWRALGAASKAGLAPAPRYFNPELGCLVCDYLPPEECQSPSISDTGVLLSNIHKLPPVHHRLDLAERITRLEKAMTRRGVSPPAVINHLRDRVHELVIRLRTDDRTSLLCHNDLLAANRLHSSGSLWALDWEYCAMGSPWYDLAVIICGDDLPEESAGGLVESYLGRPPFTGESAFIASYSQIYRYLELLWYLALDRSTGDEFLELKTAALYRAWELQ